MVQYFRLLCFVLFVLIFLPAKVFAGDSPLVLSPVNNSTVSSSKLTWEKPSYALYSSNPFRVQVDNDPGFASIDKDYYTANTYYTPSLNEGVWYWKVKAKDSNGVWSDWTSIQKFTFTSSQATPEPTPTSTPSQEPTPVPTASSTSEPSTSSTPVSAFAISNSPSEINSDQSFSLTVNLSLPNNPNTHFYLKGAFKKMDGSNYFGLTKVSGNWIKNGSSYSSQLPLTTDSSGNWNSTIDLMPDTDDAGFTGSGDYILKLGRYTDSGSGPTWSNEMNIKINHIENNQTSSNSENTTIINSKTVSPSPSSKIIIIESAPKKSTLLTSNKKDETKIASIAGVSSSSAIKSQSPSPEIAETNKKGVNVFSIIGGILTISGITSLGFLLLKSR